MDRTSENKMPDFEIDPKQTVGSRRHDGKRRAAKTWKRGQNTAQQHALLLRLKERRARKAESNCSDANQQEV